MSTILDQIEPKMKGHAERKFFGILKSTKRVRYDWGYDAMWVWEGNEEPTTETAEQMLGEAFHDRMYEASEDFTSGPTSACFVVDMLAAGLDVQIAVEELFAESYLEELTAAAKEQNPKITVGAVTQFVGKYKQETA